MMVRLRPGWGWPKRNLVFRADQTDGIDKMGLEPFRCAVLGNRKTDNLPAGVNLFHHLLKTNNRMQFSEIENDQQRKRGSFKKRVVVLI
jgi:hypothetical protein